MNCRTQKYQNPGLLDYPLLISLRVRVMGTGEGAPWGAAACVRGGGSGPGYLEPGWLVWLAPTILEGAGRTKVKFRINLKTVSSRGSRNVLFSNKYSIKQFFPLTLSNHWGRCWIRTTDSWLGSFALIIYVATTVISHTYVTTFSSLPPHSTLSQNFQDSTRILGHNIQQLATTFNAEPQHSRCMQSPHSTHLTTTSKIQSPHSTLSHNIQDLATTFPTT